MKKLFTLFALVCLIGTAVANAVTINFQVVGLSNAADAENALQCTPSLTFSGSDGVGSYTFSGTNPETFQLLAKDGYSLVNVSVDGSDIKNTAGVSVLNESSPYVIQVDPQTVADNLKFIVQMSTAAPSTTTYTIPFTVSGDASGNVIGLLFNTTEISLTSGEGTLTYEDKGSSNTPTEGKIYINLASSEEVEYDVTASYTNNNGQTVNPTVSENGEAGYTFPIDLTEVKAEAGVTITVNAKAEEEPVEDIKVTINFQVKASEAKELTAAAYTYIDTFAYQNFNAGTGEMENDPITLEADSYVVNVDEETVTLIVTPKEGYMLAGQVYSKGTEASNVAVDSSNGEVSISIPAMAWNNGTVVLIQVETGFTSQVPVEFDVTDFPNLISSYVWNGTQVGQGFDPENVELGFKEGQNDGVLTLNFGKNEDDQQYYVTSVSAAITNADGVTDVDGNIMSDQTSATLTIPASATKVVISFEASTTGVAALNTVNGEAVYYNLQGQKVANPSKGIFIVNGKKVIIK